MARNKPRPFIDTNVLFSGFYQSLGPSAQILNQHAKGKITMIISRQILEELVTNFRLKKRELLFQLKTYLTNTPPEIVADPTAEQVEKVSSLINPTDAPILAAAINSKADCLVTGNTRHFTAKVSKQTGILIFTPGIYVKRINPGGR
ncbi:putative toxin-antitoxin system toxin component, PIN family [Candidatus Microgenomates bacterium]|nr:putative toxin-antitoxin system toxin component, PIN family [Candidatus Microgenomates bacterium]